MSSAQLIVEKLKGLTDTQTDMVLKYIDTVQTRVPRGRELLQMPRELRRRLFREQIEKYGNPYKDDPNLIIDDKEGPVGHD